MWAIARKAKTSTGIEYISKKSNYEYTEMLSEARIFTNEYFAYQTLKNIEDPEFQIIKIR